MAEQITFERIVQMEPAYDKRSSDPKKNYGIHGVNLRMVLKGPLGAVQFVLFTNWQLPHVTQETIRKAQHDSSPVALKCFFLPMPADLGYHWKTRHYESQYSHESCEYCDGQPCYYDGSTLNAERIYEALLKGGSEAVWLELADFYHELAKEQANAA